MAFSILLYFRGLKIYLPNRNIVIVAPTFARVKVSSLPFISIESPDAKDTALMA